MAIPLFNSRAFLDTINGYILTDSEGKVQLIGIPNHELEATEVGKFLIGYDLRREPFIKRDETLLALLAIVADLNARIKSLEDTLAYLEVKDNGSL